MHRNVPQHIMTPHHESPKPFEMSPSKNGNAARAIILPASQAHQHPQQPLTVGIITPDMSSEMRRDSLGSDDEWSNKKPFMTYGLFLFNPSFTNVSVFLVHFFFTSICLCHVCFRIVFKRNILPDY